MINFEYQSPMHIPSQHRLNFKLFENNKEEVISHTNVGKATYTNFFINIIHNIINEIFYKDDEILLKNNLVIHNDMNPKEWVKNLKF